MTLVDGHLTPPEQPLTLGIDRLLDQLLQQHAPFGVGRQVADSYAVAPWRRQLDAGDCRSQEAIRNLKQDPGSVTGVWIGALGASVLEILEGCYRPPDHLVGRLVVQASDHAHAARVMLEARVVEADGLGRLLGVRSHGSAPWGRCIDRGAGTRAPEAEPKA